MSISTILQKFLAQQGIGYDIVPHRHSDTSMNAATLAHISAAMVAKSVILEDENGYLMAVLPANHHIKIGMLNRFLGRKMGLATEPELKSLFSDCEPGAIPPVGQAFGIDTIVDESLDHCQDIYMEAGDHEEFIHLNGASFRRLMQNVPHARIC
ncbi:MAG TPA: YbaK/EbsC family protein [Gammaproteobacteria bacterium]